MRIKYWNHHQDQKMKFHRDALKFFRSFALNDLALSAEQFDLRSNKAGPASLGEVTLHTDSIYITWGGLYPHQIMLRTCKGRKDYTGGHNIFIDVPQTDDELRRLLNAKIEQNKVSPNPLSASA